MECVVGAEIKITDITQEMLSWIHTNLVIKNPEYDKKKRMGLWTGNTEEYMNLYRQKGYVYFIPSGCYESLKGQITFKDNFPQRVIFPEVDVSLYDYQEKALEGIIRKHFGIIKAPCGSGKTRIGIAIAGKDVGRVLWLTHTTDLLEQAYNTACEFFPEDVLGTITAGNVNIGERITFATVQTISRIDLSDLKYHFSTIIVDECHRVAGSPTQVKMFYKVLNSLSASRKYGLSATVHRADGLIKTTYAALGPVQVEIPDEAVRMNTSPVAVFKIDTGITPDDCFDTDGTIVYSKMLTSLALDRQRNKLIVENVFKDWQKHSTLCLSDRLVQLREIKNMLHEKGLSEDDIRFVTGSTKKDERQQALDDMKSGKAKIILASYSLAKEGLDIPCLDKLHLLTPQKDYAVVVQSVGRVARRSEGKARGNVYDYVDELGYCKRAFTTRKKYYRQKSYVIYE